MDFTDGILKVLCDNARLFLIKSLGFSFYVIITKPLEFPPWFKNYDIASLPTILFKQTFCDSVYFRKAIYSSIFQKLTVKCIVKLRESKWY